MPKRNALDRALADRNAVMLLQFELRLRKGLISREVGDGALQRPRTAARGNFGAAQKRPDALAPAAILRL
jgi:hypothetical protein